ncbi:MOH1 [Symbiodinium pilosum]|uniref:MOH1 protein n=1 Tax=Symbiodinium pilosum TaxID=2952 RepID=A0A812S1Y2_SYMPI|nr:MOH1 [Symbiodinium pilosum]
MVFSRFRGRPSPPAAPVPDDEMVMVSKIKLQDNEDGWAQVGQFLTWEGLETTATEEAWDWAMEGDSSEGSGHQWVVDDFLITGDCEEPPSVPPVKEEVKAPQPAQAESLPTVEKPANEEPPQEEHGFRCRGCNVRIFCGTDILSSNYQAMTGPGYLVDATQNTKASVERQTVMYTTGSYVICEVSCEFCDNKLGVTYVVAPDARNEYKVGKFLLGADRLVLPPGVTHPKASNECAVYSQNLLEFPSCMRHVLLRCV